MLGLALLALAGALSTGCGSVEPGQGAGGSAGSGFVSDNPYGSSAGSGDAGTSSGSGGGSPEPPTDEGDAERAIAEADIIQVHDGTLYALSQYSGLSVIDVSVQDHLTLVGRYQASGIPFEMYYRDGMIYAMFSSWGQYVYDATASGWQWVQASRIEALDVSDPVHIAQTGSFDLPGAIADSRIVGNVLYAVSYEDGYCWGCGAKPETTITSLDIADPASIGVVGRLMYEAPDDVYGYGWYRRSILVTPDRMYVAGVEWDGESTGHSTIQVVDISDPGGALVAGATVEAAGQIESRWQMDEKGGILRVVSQPGVWSSQENPKIQTFVVHSSTDVEPLASVDIVPPKPERLRSVRFDGARAYAITAEQMDPLFTLDLSDPAAPFVAGTLEMPGWVYHMVPRGDRLLALGYDNTSPDDSLHVSLFDVSDLAHPTMLERVHFGGQWSSLPEDQDRIHKAFVVDDDAGLILVPYSGWSYGGDYCGQYESGIELIDFAGDALAARSAAPIEGFARRAFLHEGRLFSISDAEVRTFDIADRSAPVEKARLPLSTNVTQTVVVGDELARISTDWWTGRARLEVVPLSDPTTVVPLGALDLSALGGPSDYCYGWSFWGARAFASGQRLYLVFSGYEYDRAHVAVIDLSDPAAPAVEGQVELAFSMYGYGWYGGVVPSGDTIVQHGTTLVFQHIASDWYGVNPVFTASLEVVDLSDPAHPAHAASVPLPHAEGYTPLQIDGSVVAMSHWAMLPDDTDKVRFYIDRVDVADPAAPSTLPAINVPGSLAAWDSARGRAMTIDYARGVAHDVTWEECYSTYGWYAWFEPGDPTGERGDCSYFARTFKLLDIAGSVASVIDQKALQNGSYLGNLLVGTDRVFAASTSYGWAVDSAGGASGASVSSLFAVSGLRTGHIELSSYAVEGIEWPYPVSVQGEKLVTLSWSVPGISVFDATDMENVSYERKGDLPSYAYGVTLSGDDALCSMGPWGLAVVDLQ